MGPEGSMAASPGSGRCVHQMGTILERGLALGGLTAQLVMHPLHLGMEGEELILQIAAAVKPLQSSQGFFQMVFAGNQGKAPLGTGFCGHSV